MTAYGYKEITNRKCSSATYIVFIVIMCLGLPIALLLSPASKGEYSALRRLLVQQARVLMAMPVWRKDGTRVHMHKAATWLDEFAAVGKLFVSRRILLLLPAFFIRCVGVTFGRVRKG